MPWQERFGYRDTELFPIDIGEYGYPYVPVRVNGKEVRLAWDTGNMVGLILSAEVARRQGLPVVDERPLLDSDGKVVGSFPVYGVEELEVFGRTWSDQRAMEYRGDDLDGLLGPRFVRGRRFTLDYGNRILAVSHTPFPPASEPDAVLPMVASPRLAGLILVRGEVNGRQVLIELDTGKSRTAVDPELVSLLELPEARNGYRIDAIGLGPHVFAVPSAKGFGFRGISEGLPEPILLSVGSDILSQVVLSVDYPRNLVVLSR